MIFYFTSLNVNYRFYLTIWLIFNVTVHIMSPTLSYVTLQVLLLREQGEVRALGAHCTHYGAPLVRGAYDGGGTVRCPWHGACFNTVTGDIEDFPGDQE